MGLLLEGIGDDDMGFALLPKKDKAWIDAKLEKSLGVVQTTGTVLALSLILVGGALIYKAGKR